MENNIFKAYLAKPAQVTTATNKPSEKHNDVRITNYILSSCTVAVEQSKSRADLMKLIKKESQSLQTEILENQAVVPKDFTKLDNEIKQVGKFVSSAERDHSANNQSSESKGRKIKKRSSNRMLKSTYINPWNLKSKKKKRDSGIINLNTKNIEKYLDGSTRPTRINENARAIPTDKPIESHKGYNELNLSCESFIGEEEVSNLLKSNSLT